jgi:hypothetical protein
MPQQPVLINGVAYDWGSISFVLFGQPLVGITKIDYKETQKKENLMGWGRKPVARGYGAFEYEGSIEVYVDEWKRIIAASPTRSPLEIPPFDIPVVYGGKGVLPTKDVLRAVEFLENPFTVGTGDTSIKVTIPLIIAAIDR